jgi:hypothetical protein
MRLAAHPLGNRFLRSGLKLKPGSSALGPTVARMTNLLRKLDRTELAEQEAEESFRRRLPGLQAEAKVPKRPAFGRHF